MKTRIAYLLILLLCVSFCVPDAFGVVYCSKCGTANEEGAKYCKNCGEPLPGDFMTILRVTAKSAQLFHNGEVIGSAGKNTQFNYAGDAGDYYDVTWGGNGVSLRCQIKKADCGSRSFAPAQADNLVGEPLSARDTSEALAKYRNNEEKLRQLQVWGHFSYANAVVKYLDAAKWSRDRRTSDARERAARAFEEAEKIRERQDALLATGVLGDRATPIFP